MHDREIRVKNDQRRFLYALFAQLKIIDPVKVHPKADELENIH